jgi:two-component system cell cycle sensor histidine kinase/response regulator CckA
MKTSEEERLENEVRHLRAELEELRTSLAGGEGTSLQHALESLRESETRYRSVVAALSEGVVLQVADGTILACNPAAENILGMTVDQMMGRTSLDPRWRAIHPDGSTFAGDTHPAMVTLRTGEPQHNVPMGVHKPDGSLTWISINTQPLLRDGEDTPHAVVSSFTDVTEFRTVQQALERSARQLRLALSSARAGIWEWDIETNEFWWGEGVAAIFGLAPDEFDGSFEGYFELIHPQDRDRVRAAIRRALDNPEERYEVEHRVHHEEGKIRWVYGSGAVLRDEHGKPLRMNGAVLDITKSKDLEQRLLHAQKMESVGRLAGGVAHDFNNLLTAILVSADFGLEQLDSDEPLDCQELRSHFASVQHAAEQGSRLTRQLLSFARKQVLALAPLRVGDIVEGCHAMLGRLLGEHIELELHCNDESSVLSDPGQLEQVVVNLAVNARDAMPKGGRLCIEVGDVELDSSYVEDHPNSQPGRHVKLSVTDTGSGIDPQLLEKVFEPFFTTKAEGSGLGLATCHGIVSQLGGHLVIESEPGQGTTVQVYLPSSVAEASDAPADEAEPTRGEETVLIVEDEPLVRRLTRRGLEKHGYVLVEAENPSQAIELAARFEGRIDLLVSDVLMPGMSGVELAEALVATRPEMRVLLVSGYSDQHLQPVVGGRELHFLQKPYTVSELGQRVREVLDAD